MTGFGRSWGRLDMGYKWQTHRLGDLCKRITDGKHGDCKDQEASGFYFLSVKDVLGDRLIYQNSRQITEFDFTETHRRTALEAGDVLFTNTGTIGRMAIARDDPKTARTTFQKSVAILKPKRDLITPSARAACCAPCGLRRRSERGARHCDERTRRRGGSLARRTARQ